jgi:hypothetical protein
MPNVFERLDHTFQCFDALTNRVLPPPAFNDPLAGLFPKSIPNDARGASHNNREIRDVFCNNRPRPDDSSDSDS